MTQTYEDILSRSWNEIPEDKLLPSGGWRLKCRGASHRKGKGEQNDSIMFVYEAIEPMDDVDDGALADLGPDYDYKQNRIFHRFWLESSGDLNTVRRHIEKHGVDTEELSVGESLKAVRGKTIVGILGQRSFQRKDGTVGEENFIQSFEVDE